MKTMARHVVTDFFFNDTATTEIYALSPTRRSSDLSEQVLDQILDVAFPNRIFVAGVTGEPGFPASVGPDTTPNGLSDALDRKSTRLNSSHAYISYAVFCLIKNRQ